MRIIGASLMLLALGPGASGAPATQRPYEISFWSPERGFVAVQPCNRCRRTAILVTSDGGRTFDVALRTDRAVRGVETVAEHGAIAWLDNGVVLRTADGGRHWRRDRSALARSWLRDRVALESSPVRLATWEDAMGVEGNAFGPGARLRLRVTHDGGAHWTRRKVPCPRVIAQEAFVDLATPRIGWLLCNGQGAAGQMQKAVLRTRNGGRTWRLVAEVNFAARRFHGGLSGYGYPAGISVAPDGFGILWEGRGTLYTTRDGGSNWISRPRLAEPEVVFGSSGAAFPGGRGLALLWHSDEREVRLHATGDYGRTWHIVHRWKTP